MQKGRVIRVVLTLLVAAIVILTVAPYIANRVSTSAVVNAPLAPIAAPFNGHVTTASKPVGTRIRPNEPLFEAVAETRNRRHQQELAGRVRTLKKRLAAVNRQRARLQDVAVQLSARVKRYREHALARLRHEIAETQAVRDAAHAKADQASAAFERSQRLSAKGLTPEAEHDARAADGQVARARVRELRARLDRLAAEVAAVQDGAFVRAGANDVPYSQQRADEVELRLSDLAQQRARLSAELASAREQLDAEKARQTRNETFRPRAPVHGVVWAASGAEGESIATGQVVLHVADCQARFVEVAVDERHFETIRAGDIARVQLKGSGRTLQAPVIAVRGAGAYNAHPNLAARVPTAERGQLRVLVSLEGVGLDRSANRFCHIGRTAEVYFARSAPTAIGDAADAVSEWASTLWRQLYAGLNQRPIDASQQTFASKSGVRAADHSAVEADQPARPEGCGAGGLRSPGNERVRSKDAC